MPFAHPELLDSEASDLKKTTTMKYGEDLVSGLLGGPLFFLILLCHEHFLRDSELPIHYLALASEQARLARDSLFTTGRRELPLRAMR